MYASRTLTDQENLFHKFIKKHWQNLAWDVTDLNQFCWVEIKHLLIETDYKPLVTIVNKQDLD